MIRLLAICLTLLIGAPCLAQTRSVVVKSELSAESTMVGQPLILRVTVLVPTWMPEPPQFPSFELPNVIVRLPSRASSPVSERIDGETWSGVSRAYRLYPMIAGDFALPPQTVGIVYAAPDTREPVPVEETLDPVTFSAVVPKGAEGLDPLILAEAFSLAQSFEGGEEKLGQGDTVSRVVTAKISGTSALFIPPLIPPLADNVARAYPKDPMVTESEDRGLLSGSRQETVSYVAQYGGNLELPEISLDWFNTKTGKVETATLEGVSLEVNAPAQPRELLLNHRQTIVLAGAVLLLGLALTLLIRYVLPFVRQARVARRAAWLASEAYAAKQVTAAIRRQELPAVYQALAVWSPRCPGQLGAELQSALAQVGAVTYGLPSEGGGRWSDVAQSFKVDRTRRLRRSTASDLPSLNGL
ncbi:BatD family protein [Shimia sediminis]|uniref:BatD family protein n=1 Tax=Shimia sediminis TaxID=2497945 RepID=UPI0013DEB8A4|nr:BatD family protein [Shimia sediminis]